MGGRKEKITTQHQAAWWCKNYQSSTTSYYYGARYRTVCCRCNSIMVMLCFIILGLDDYFCTMMMSHIVRENENPTTTPLDARDDFVTFGGDDTNGTIWSWTRRDRSGAVIMDMLSCHAYAFHHQKKYGGSCLARGGNATYPQKLIKLMGLEKILPFDCPENINEADFVEFAEYRKDDTAIFTADYMNRLHSLVNNDALVDRSSSASSSSSSYNTNKKKMTVHIRRGDVFPCKMDEQRYLPNRHYLGLIDRYNKNKEDYNVIIHSESQSAENFDIFQQRGYQVQLDKPLEDAWTDIVTADIVIISRSSFSYVPAMFAKGKVVYTPFWHKPLPHWDIVEQAYVAASLAEVANLPCTKE